MSKFSYINDHYLKNKLKIFPVIPNAKLPLIDAWQKDCSCDLQQVLYWLENAGDCNIGLPANENNLFIIDVDMHDVDGLSSFQQLLFDLGLTPSDIDTLQQRTPSGGMHFIFKSDDDLKNVLNTSNSFEDYSGIDIRTRGYILVQPSHIDDKYYIMNDKEINEMPKELKEFILKNNKVKVEENKEYVRPIVVDKGNRDTSLFQYINYLYYSTKLNKDEITLLAHYFNESVCKPPLSNGVVEYKIKQLFKKKRNKFIICHLSGDEENE